MAAQGIKLSISDGITGSKGKVNLFQFFNSGIRKKLPKLVADKYLTNILENINTNKYGFELSRSWAAKKRRLGLDDRPFIAYGDYKSNLKVVSAEGHLAVGFPSTKRHPRAGVTYADLALQLEYGDLAKNIPARPLWQRTTEDFLVELRRSMNELLAESLKK